MTEVGAPSERVPPRSSLCSGVLGDAEEDVSTEPTALEVEREQLKQEYGAHIQQNAKHQQTLVAIEVR